MKLLQKISLVALCILFALPSCTIEKRLHTAGYHIEWKTAIHRAGKSAISKNKYDNQQQNPQNMLVLTNENATNTPHIEPPVIDLTLTATSDNPFTTFTPNPSQTINFPAPQLMVDCDNIVLRNGEEIESKVLEITTDEIKYKKCENMDGPIYSIRKSEVFMIKYPNGTKDIITPHNAPANTNNYDNPHKDNEEKKSGGFGVVSFISGIGGLLIAAIPLGIVAIIFGIIGMQKRKIKS